VTSSNPKTLVLGLGNTLLSDEGVGVHVVRALQTHSLPAGVECLDGGTGGFILLEPMQAADRIVMIDAAADGNPIDLLDLFYMLDGGREVTLYAITIDPQQPISLELSPVIKQAADEAIERILAELASPPLES
jgi:hydrogenase maturation protease